MGFCLSKCLKKILTFRVLVVDNIAIYHTPHTPRWLLLLLLVFVFQLKTPLFSEDFYYDALEYKKLEINDLELITGFIPEFSYDILGNSFSLRISLNKIISNSLGLYENQIDKEIFKKNYFRKNELKIESELNLLSEEKNIYEKNLKKITLEIEAINREIISLDNLIGHKKVLLILNKEIFNYHLNEFEAGEITTIEFLKFKQSYLDSEYSYQELLYNREVLNSAKRSKGREISISK